MLAWPAFAGTDLSSFDTVIAIQRNGSVVAVEHIVPAHPAPNFVWSTAAEYPGEWSIHQPRIFDLYQVTTADGKPLPYTFRRRGSRYEVEINTTGVTEIRLVYNIGNAIEFHADNDRLLWNPGEGWRGAASNVTVFVQVPPEAASSFSAQAFLRGHGLLPSRESSAGPDRVWFAVPDLALNDRLIVEAAVAPGIVYQRSALQRTVWFISANTIVLLPFVVLAVMFVLRKIKGLPEEDSTAIVTRYEPPAGLSPAEVGLLIDDSLDPRDITATIIDLAVRKYLRLEQGTPDEGVEFAGQDFVLRLLRPIQDWKDLRPHEQTVLFNTFYGGQWTKLSSLTLRFYPIVPALRDQIGIQLRAKGLYWVNPRKAPWLRMANTLVLFAILYVVQLLGIFSFADSWLLSLSSVCVSAIIVQLMGRKLTAKTFKGIGTYREIVGFREFLNTCDHDRLERMPADLFERCLPYAIALGVEHHWANAFSAVAMGPPEWFNADAEFNTTRLAAVLDLFSKPKTPMLPVSPTRMRAAKV